MADFDVQIYGLAATKRLMRELEPDLLKEMNREIRDALKPVAQRAKDLIPESPPLSGWGRSVNSPGSRPSFSPYGRRWPYDRLEWNSEDAKRSIVIRQGGRRRRGTASRAAWTIRSNDPAAAAFELMGLGKSNVSMVRNVSARYPSTQGRVLYRAWEEKGGDRIERDVVDTIRRFEREFNARLDAAGGS